MKIKYVTFTGADDSIQPNDLISISKDYPFVEWGILFSKNQGNRYPSEDWIYNLVCQKAHAIQKDNDLTFNLSGHLCGAYAKELLKGRLTLNDQQYPLTEAFGRFQINMGQEAIEILNKEKIIEQMNRTNAQFILQLHNGSQPVWEELNHLPNCSTLYDQSGGRGILQNSWQSPKHHLTGYAGGLGPDNLEDELFKIGNVIGDKEIWIDMESKVRTDDQFDLSKCIQCLQIVSKRM